jgi:hypothetical protein
MTIVVGPTQAVCPSAGRLKAVLQSKDGLHSATSNLAIDAQVQSRCGIHEPKRSKRKTKVSHAFPKLDL